MRAGSRRLRRRDKSLAAADGSRIDQDLSEERAECEAHQQASDVGGLVDADARGTYGKTEDEVISDEADKAFQSWP